MLGDPNDVTEGLNPMFYIGLDRDFEIGIRTKIKEEIEEIKDLERQLEEAREFEEELIRKLILNKEGSLSDKELVLSLFNYFEEQYKKEKGE